MLRSNQKGFSAAGLVLLLVVLALIAFAGWRVFSSQQSNTAQPAGNGETQTAIPEVKSKQDLKRSEEFLNATDIDSELDTSELDEALNE